MIKKVSLKGGAFDAERYFQYSPIGTLNGHMLSAYQAENRKTGFHVHDNADEMFLCVEGELDLESSDGITHLNEGDFAIVERGTPHRPIVKSHMKCLLIELEGAKIREVDKV